MVISMNNYWLLDVKIRDNRVFLSIYSETNGSVHEKMFNLNFYGYILGNEPEIIARELYNIDGVEDAWVEEWRTPPYYNESVKVVVYKTTDYGLFRKIVETSLRKSLKVVNNYPHPLVEALYRAGLRPLVRIRFLNSRLETIEWNPFDKDPFINYVIVGFENGYYFVETNSEKSIFWKISDVVDYLVSGKYVLGFADPYLYVKLVEIEPCVKNIVYTWILSGSHHPSEFFEWSRLSYTPLSLMNNMSIGRILSTIETLHARDRKYLVYKTHGRRENWKTMRELLINDCGGVVYQPKPGLYWNVCQIDFKSLYPSIIVKYNVSGETVDRINCVNELEIPWSNHKICLDEKGVVPESIEKLIVLKDTYSELFNQTKESVYEYRKNAIKWILVASFGYLGYRNSLFGSIMAHEIVTSTSRELMRKARLIVEKLGYRVIHIIIDSLFIEGVFSKCECDFIRNRIVEETGFDAKVEAHYIWLYIPRSFNDNKGVANKYYGLFSNNQFKIKGLMCIRRDTPLFIKKAQLEALKKLFEARSPREFYSKLVEAHRVVDQYVEKIVKGEYSLNELIICRESSVRNSYRKPYLYVYRTKPPFRLIYVGDKLTPYEEYSGVIDINKYIELLEKARRELPSVNDVLKYNFV